MSAASNYGENAALNALLGTSVNRYVDLHNGDPGEDGTANKISSTRLVGQFAAASGGSKSTAGGTTPTLGSYDGTNGATASHWSVWDAPSGGNCLAKGAIGTPKVVNTGDPVNCDITVTAD